MERLKKYLLLTFAVSWISWGTLALLTGTGVLAFSSAPGLALFVAGGFGPTIAAYAVILSFWLAHVYKRTGCVFACSVLHRLSNTVVSGFVLKVNWVLLAGLIVTTAAAILLWYYPWTKHRNHT